MRKLLRIFIPLVIILSLTAEVYAAPLVLGRRYPLNTTAERGTLVWRFVTFNRSITGGINVQLEVLNKRAQALSYFDEYRDIVDEGIQKNTISKFSLNDTKVSFSSDRYATLTFQVSKLGRLYYIPLRVQYKDGFEDYLVRLYFNKGKFSLASRLLQQGKIVNNESLQDENNDLDKESQASDSLDSLDAKDIESSISDNESTKPTAIDKESQGQVISGPEMEKLSGDDLSEEAETDLEDPTFEDPSDIQFDLTPQNDEESTSESEVETSATESVEESESSDLSTIEQDPEGSTEVESFNSNEDANNDTSDESLESTNIEEEDGSEESAQ